VVLRFTESVYWPTGTWCCSIGHCAGLPCVSQLVVGLLSGRRSLAWRRRIELLETSRKTGDAITRAGKAVKR
jgi:hypothetical protein